VRNILGKHSQEEIDAFWMELLKAPEWLGYLEIGMNNRVEKNYEVGWNE
jgi:hypothetical protein